MFWSSNILILYKAHKHTRKSIIIKNWLISSMSMSTLCYTNIMQHTPLDQCVWIMNCIFSGYYIQNVNYHCLSESESSFNALSSGSVCKLHVVCDANKASSQCLEQTGLPLILPNCLLSLGIHLESLLPLGSLRGIRHQLRENLQEIRQLHQGTP